MTREEAIKKFELQLLIRSNGYYDHLKAGGKQDIAEEEHLDAMQMAIAALREQDVPDTDVDKCEWCWHFNEPRSRYYLLSQGNGMYKEAMFEFCPMCGRRLEEV